MSFVCLFDSIKCKVQKSQRLNLCTDFSHTALANRACAHVKYPFSTAVDRACRLN